MKNNLEFYRCIIGPGQVVFSREPTYLYSTCGNGVIVTLWDRMRRSGGMAHCVYPKRRLFEKGTKHHADVAIPLLVKEFFNFSSYAGNLEAQIFGGGNLRGFSKKRALQTVKAARKILRKFRIDIVSEDVGGVIGRKIVFNTHTGDALEWRTKSIRLSDWAPEYALS